MKGTIEQLAYTPAAVNALPGALEAFDDLGVVQQLGKGLQPAADDRRVQRVALTIDDAFDWTSQAAASCSFMALC